MITKPIGEWITMVITVNHKSQYGKCYFEWYENWSTFPVQSEEMGLLWVADSKFAGWDGFGKFTTGKIGLQGPRWTSVAFRKYKNQTTLKA